MAVNLSFLGHAGFLVESGVHRLAIDPWLTGNPVAKQTAAEIECQTIAITHGHSDHIADLVSIAKANKASVVAAFEICEWLGEQGHDNNNPGNPGGRVETAFGSISFTQAFHSSSFEGRYMGMPCGLIIEIGGKTIYHCGDTGLFGDMKLIGEIYKPDVALIPIGDRFTMGPELATRAAEWIGAPIVVPIHYNTFPPIAVDVSRFAPRGISVKVLEPGESFDL
jgi:L-ascorbate metabolism protein UlaG (beta-lactamase superfamily)